MFCQYCGKEMNDDADICAICGRKQEIVTVETTAKKPNNFMLLFFTIIIIFVFSYIVYLYIPPHFKNDGIGDYYKKSDGTYATNEWIKIKNYWYYFNQGGYLAKGGVTADGYYVDENGKMAKKEWKKINGIYFYFDIDGKMAKNKWIRDKFKWYYVNNNGAMLKNTWVDGTYYVNENGEMLKNSKTPDGKFVDKNGKKSNITKIAKEAKKSNTIKETTIMPNTMYLLNESNNNSLIVQSENTYAINDFSNNNFSENVNSQVEYNNNPTDITIEEKPVDNQNITSNNEMVATTFGSYQQQNNSNSLQTSYKKDLSGIAGARVVSDFVDSGLDYSRFDTINFGKYYKSTSKEKLHDISWFVLEKDPDNHMALLISQYVLDHKSFNNNDEYNITWENCDLREWLNNDFYNIAFSDEEKSKIILNDYTTCLFKNDDKYDSITTSDKVALLSVEEARMYFGNGYLLDNRFLAKTAATTYACNAENRGEIIGESKREVEYWLRTTCPCGSERDRVAMTINDKGTCGDDDFWGQSTSGKSVNMRGIGVRPIIWVKYDGEISSTNYNEKKIDLNGEKIKFDVVIKQTNVIKANKESIKDGTLGLVGNEQFYSAVKVISEIKNYDKAYNYYKAHEYTDTKIKDSLGHNIKKFFCSPSSYRIFAENAIEANEITDYINSGAGDYTLCFYDVLIEDRGNYTADVDSARFSQTIKNHMLDYATPLTKKDVKIDLKDTNPMKITDINNYELNINGDLYYVEVLLNQELDNRNLINNYYYRYMDLKPNIIDSYGHKILRVSNGSTSFISIYTETYDDAVAIASVLNSDNSSYTLYFYDNVIENTGNYTVDDDKVEFETRISSYQINRAEPRNYRDYKLEFQDDLNEIIDGSYFEINDYGDLFWVAVFFNSSIPDFSVISKYSYAHESDSNIVDNKGHKIKKVTVGTAMGIYTETYEEAEAIASYLNSQDAEYILYFMN